MTRILVIEDETSLRNQVLEWLTLENYETVGASDGEEGLQEAFREPPDLIISDITMPRLDGYGVLLELRANPSTSAIPFIFTTARATHDDIRTGMELGADDYITKPFTRVEFMNAIQARLRKKAIQDEGLQQKIGEWQQAIEHEREQRQLKAKLVAMFTHDFRNPLTTILSSNSLLRTYGHRLDEERRSKYYDRIEASANQLVQMLDDMLIISQMESGKFDLTLQPIKLEAFIRQIIEEFQIIHSETYSLDFKSQFDGIVMADARLLRQIVSNLISNAIKYSHHGSTVKILLDAQEGEVILAVQDEGIGIPETEQVRLFMAFQRASNVGDIAGTGLGLAIIKQAVDLLSGKIDLESRIGVGTTMTIRFPIVPT
jgi:signal transduction histidine kinase